MRVECPSCQASYDLPPQARLRIVRCARCGHEWRVAEPEATAATAAASLPAPRAGLPVVPPADARQVDPLAVAGMSEPQAAPGRIRLAWLLTLVVWAGLLGLAIVFHRPIMAAWPPSARIYNAVGLS